MRRKRVLIGRPVYQLMRKGNKERRFAMAAQMKNLKPTKS